MSKHPPKHPVDHPRLFANKYRLSRQLPYQGQGDLWLGEKSGKAYWVYYIPLTTIQAKQLWEKWKHNWEDLKGKVTNKALLLPAEAQKEEDFAVIAFPAPYGDNLNKEQKTLSELDLALLMLDMSQSLIDAIDSQNQLTISPAYMYRRQEGGFAIFGWGLGYLNKILAGDQSVEAPAYLSPEKFDPSQKVGSESAIFSLGVSLFELASGVLPFGMKGGARLAQVNTPLPELPQYSARFNHILQLMLARKADRRPSADTLFRLANTFIKEQQWKSVGGFSFSPSLSGTSPLAKMEAVKQPSIVEKTIPPKKVERSPKEQIEPKANKKLKLWFILIPLVAVIGVGIWFGVRKTQTIEPKEVQTNPLQHAEDLAHLLNSKQYFEELIEAMTANHNLPPTEKTFLRLAQMQLKNLEMEIQEHLIVQDDSTISWKGTVAYNWLQNTQSQLDRNIQNLEILR